MLLTDYTKNTPRGKSFYDLCSRYSISEDVIGFEELFNIYTLSLLLVGRHYEGHITEVLAMCDVVQKFREKNHANFSIAIGRKKIVFPFFPGAICEELIEERFSSELIWECRQGFRPSETGATIFDFAWDEEGGELRYIYDNHCNEDRIIQDVLSDQELEDIKEKYSSYLFLTKKALGNKVKGEHTNNARLGIMAKRIMELLPNGFNKPYMFVVDFLLESRLLYSFKNDDYVENFLEKSDNEKEREVGNWIKSAAKITKQ